MKSYKKQSPLFVIFFSLLAMGCENGQEQISVLQAENSQLSSSYEGQLMETRNAVNRADSLQTIIHDMQEEILKLQGEAKPVYNASDADEQAIEDLVGTLHRGWTSMFKTKDKQDVLKYFLPEYTASAVRINHENLPQVRRRNDTNFDQWLDQLLAVEGISLSFGETKFLYSEVKGDVFVTSYRTTLRVYENNRLRHTSSLVTQLAGERSEGNWKVGHYNWVAFNY